MYANISIQYLHGKRNNEITDDKQSKSKPMQTNFKPHKRLEGLPPPLRVILNVLDNLLNLSLRHISGYVECAKRAFCGRKSGVESDSVPCQWMCCFLLKPETDVEASKTQTMPPLPCQLLFLFLSEKNQTSIASVPVHTLSVRKRPTSSSLTGSNPWSASTTYTGPATMDDAV